MNWQVKITPRAKKDLKKLDKNTKIKIITVLKKMCSEKETVDIKKLKGTEDKWRLRVGMYRVILKIDSNGVVTVYALRILHRKEVYRNI